MYLNISQLNRYCLELVKSVLLYQNIYIQTYDYNLFNSVTYNNIGTIDGITYCNMAV